MGNNTDWVSIVTACNHNLACKNNGTIWSWGYNEFGQLGLGYTSAKVTTPSQIGTNSDWFNQDWMTEPNLPQMAVGSKHTISLKTNNTIWAWGNNSWSELGLGDTINRNTPAQIGFGADWSMPAIGPNCSVAIKTNGTLWRWGNSGTTPVLVGE
jgi:alpha-tubulin suppressor-like RCC1 family protein